MKIKLLTGVLSMIVPLLIAGIFLICLAGGGAGSVVSPVAAFATEEEAYRYQYVGAELGVPWDIVLLSDGIQANEDGLSSLESYDPLLTALQFCILTVEKFELEEWEEKTETVDEAGNIVTEYETESEWVSAGTKDYTGKDDILSFIGLTESDLHDTNVNLFIKDVYDRVEAQNTDNVAYKAVLLSNSDYEAVLRDYICLDEKNIKYVLELYDANYMGILYGYTYRFDNIVLPDIIQGDLNRAQLAEVAVSLIGHPYMMGGKSSQAGSPAGPLDCSGYVDWVYIQCFGRGVSSSGSLPAGIAMSGTALMWYASEEIEEDELQTGDLGFLRDPAMLGDGQVNHVGIFIGSYNGKSYWIHCGGSYYGTDRLPKGRVGISVRSGDNSYNPVDGSTFEPPMKSCNFQYFRRPQFAFNE